MRLRTGIFATAAFLVVVAFALPGRCWAEMFFYEDDQGRMHYTNQPRMTTYRVFAIFKNFPNADRDVILRVVRQKADKYGLDNRLIQALIQVESNFKPGAVSHKGAQGLMQIMPGTGKELGLDQPHDIEANIEAGVKYFRMQLDRFGSHDLALAAYNAGPAQVERYGGVPPFKETQDYVKKVLSIYHKLQGGA
ncbi:lytic transglycosylase catalytic [Desulfovibrio ferrophilus]|uniref:Lytic transglycosylase catalytic n=2 Tax=Desulfovibrio ferrophilus TaxID=241368 RepID=A0A2Z6AX75_9BACT|nr:lytic transglycosylase catalytic [Desulfovibrio ferrophilus]